MKENINIKMKHCFYMLLGLPFLLLLNACEKDKSVYYDYQLETSKFDGNAIEYLEANRGFFDSLLYVLDFFPELKDSVAKKELSIFAPVNRSFAEAMREINALRALQDQAPIALADLNKDQLKSLLSRYFLQGKYYSEDYQVSSDALVLNSLDKDDLAQDYWMTVEHLVLEASGIKNAGPQRLVFSDPRGSIFRTEWVSTSTIAINIQTDNAVINILTPDHIFGFNSLNDK